MKAFIKKIWACLKEKVTAIYFKPVTATAATETQKPEVEPVNKITLAILLNSQPADGLSANTIQALITNDAGAPVAGAVVNFSVTSGAVTPAQGTTDANGQAVASITGTAVGPVTLTAILEDGTTASVNTLYFVAVPASIIVPAPAAPAAPAATVATITVAEHESILEKLKGILIYLGHDIEDVFEETVALAKKL
ncbi:Ig-like domain-containing protein [Sodalis ligni]|uniref:Ig-like domain-containing protein n=1 Tax=Sodalis ligni TaxID=2697027 RepID=UPI00193F172D|nr:Ig-like domain-containing protein [Sodalis ligni]QWA09805.1 Ig-like domain-containing protein [Sodalis ligni]